MHPLPEIGSGHGSPMGRPDTINDTEHPVEFEIQRLRWVDGDYDEGGAYWGHVEGEYIFRAVGESPAGVEEMFVRATDLRDAKAKILETYPKATFSHSAELEAFLAAYVETALWSSHNDRYEDSPGEESEFLRDSGYELADETMAIMRKACADFLEKHGDLVSRAMTEGAQYSIESAGHDFWLTRNGHGAGFWDRGLGQVGQELTEAANSFGEAELYVGDDDLIYVNDQAASSLMAKPGS